MNTFSRSNSPFTIPTGQCHFDATLAFNGRKLPDLNSLKTNTLWQEDKSATRSISPSPKPASAVTKNTVSNFLLGNYVFSQLYSVDQKSLASEKELSDFLDSLQENLSWPDTVITTKNSVKLRTSSAMNIGYTVTKHAPSTTLWGADCSLKSVSSCSFK